MRIWTVFIVKNFFRERCATVLFNADVFYRLLKLSFDFEGKL